ncbi:MAG: CopG family transcriptional regulator [Terracidiphilus sp.]|jgi:metal-responsive CopG/Arc/MetJ family transcriptional regulator
METVQIVLDDKLLMAANKAARQSRLNRSQLVREALRDYLQRLEMKAREGRDREGYAKKPQADGEWQAWESEAAWPEL